MKHSWRWSQTLDEAMRSFTRRPSLHPHKARKTQAGPAHHTLIGKFAGRTTGRLYVGMRKYGYIEIELAESGNRTYDRNRYARDIQNALTDAWRC